MRSVDRDQDESDPPSLGAIEQAMFVMERFEKGMTAQQLLECLKDEKSLTQAYIIFFSQMGWIKEAEGEWRLIKKGSETLMELKSPEKRAVSRAI